jgi:histidinol phosphatase-like PHP family hydrolase
MTRRGFLGTATSLGACFTISRAASAAPDDASATSHLDFPRIDYHVHLDNSTIDRVVELSKRRGVKFGIVEHAGTKENQYPMVLSNDAELSAYLKMLDGQPVLKGIQAEWTDWLGCFSPEVLGQLDFVLSDAMTFPGKKGERMKLWENGAEIGPPQAFMDRYVDWHVEILERQPLDLLANTTWLPPVLAADYDPLWTERRMEKVIAAAVKHRVALEISAGYKLPKLPFLKLAKAAGATFSFGSNGRYPNMGRLDYCLDMARQLGLRQADLFTPAPPGQKPFQRRGRT